MREDSSTTFLDAIIDLLTEQEVKDLKRLQSIYIHQVEADPHYSCDEWDAFSNREGLLGCEAYFCPESQYYRSVLDNLRPDDVVFDVGAGDMRLSYLMANRCHHVTAVEVNPSTLGWGLVALGIGKPPNLTPIVGNAFKVAIPERVTLITYLVRHSQHDLPENWWKGRRVIHTIGGRLHILDGGGATPSRHPGPNDPLPVSEGGHDIESRSQVNLERIWIPEGGTNAIPQ